MSKSSRIARGIAVAIPALTVIAMGGLTGPAVADGQSTARHPTALIDVSALTANSDFTVFMREDVPEDVRRAALRRLWVLMRLPVSCDELCYEPEPAALDLERVASGQRAVPSQ